MSYKKDRPEIWFLHLVILRVMVDYYREHKRTASYEMLEGDDGLVNAWLYEHGVNDPSYTLPLGSINSLAKGIAMLRAAGLLHSEYKYAPHNFKHFFYGNLPTQTGETFIDGLGTDWREWPIVIPIVNHQLNLKQAMYREDIRV